MQQQFLKIQRLLFRELPPTSAYLDDFLMQVNDKLSLHLREMHHWEYLESCMGRRFRPWSKVYR